MGFIANQVAMKTTKGTWAVISQESSNHRGSTGFVADQVVMKTSKRTWVYCSCWRPYCLGLAPNARTLKERTYEHHTQNGIGGRPITVRYGYSTLAWVPEKKEVGYKDVLRPCSRSAFVHC